MMAKSLNLATLASLAVAAMLLGHTSAATYIVGDTGLWTFPPNATSYATWASRYTFTVGDLLVFNFVTGSHTVATVTKDSFDTCNLNNPISLITTGPANITLTSPGETYFLCTVSEHCATASQKLAINVTASSSPPAPPPSIEPTPAPPSIEPTPPPPSIEPTPSPPSIEPTTSPPSIEPTPSPPSIEPTPSPPSVEPTPPPITGTPSPATTHIVGDSRGWTFDPNGTVYPTWVSRHNFTVGDILVFNFTTGSHTVATVTKESYDTCNLNNPIALNRDGPASITLTSPGETYFLCTVGQHCATASQKLAINVTAASSGENAPPPPLSSGGDTPSAPPPSTAARNGLVSIFTIFISVAVYLLF